MTTALRSLNKNFGKSLNTSFEVSISSKLVA